MFVVEGEKDADRLAKLGLIATTNAGGAGKWQAEFSQYLKGRRVVVLPDNDEPGREHAQDVARSLSGLASSLRIVELPGLLEKGDVSDFLTQGGTLQDLLDLAKDTPEWKPTATPDEPAMVCLANIQSEEIRWLWPGRIALGKLTMIQGDPEVGKSFLTLDIAARVSRAGDRGRTIRARTGRGKRLSASGRRRASRYDPATIGGRGGRPHTGLCTGRDLFSRKRLVQVGAVHLPKGKCAAACDRPH